MADLFDTPLRRIMPLAFTRDPETLALIEAIDEGIKPLVEVLDEINYKRDPSQWNNALVDELAWQNHVDFYEATLPIEQKVALVQNAFRFHQKKGTNAAVEEIIGILFTEGVVEDWYQYGGQPGHFRVLTPNASVTTDRALEFIRAIDSVKRLSSKLDTVIIQASEDQNNYFGFGLQMGEVITI